MAIGNVSREELNKARRVVREAAGNLRALKRRCVVLGMKCNPEHPSWEAGPGCIDIEVRSVKSMLRKHGCELDPGPYGSEHPDILPVHISEIEKTVAVLETREPP